MSKFKSILIIDDDEISNYLTEMTIKTEDLAEKIEIALNGEEGLAKLKNIPKNGCMESPELILLDLSMPVMDGFSFLQKFNELEMEHKPHIVILTSSRNRSDIARIKKYKIKGYLNKPFSAAELRHIMYRKD